MRPKYTEALGTLVDLLIGMRRSKMEAGEVDWLHTTIRALREFSDSAVEAVTAELQDTAERERGWYRPSQGLLLDMLRAAHEAEIALAAITQAVRLG